MAKRKITICYNLRSCRNYLILFCFSIVYDVMFFNRNETLFFNSQTLRETADNSSKEKNAPTLISLVCSAAPVLL